MKVSAIKPGVYIVAVSGGVDSVSLLHALAQRAGLQLVVVHFDHGIRPDSHKDAAFVKQLAAHYQLQYEGGQANLGPSASEESARKARYTFLQTCRNKYYADAIIMAHHQNDVIETIAINCIRGTGWRGLSSLRSHNGLLRPLLGATKSEIQDYAAKHKLQWRQDSTNDDTRYLRNHVRIKLSHFLQLNRNNVTKLIDLSRRQAELTRLIDQETASLSQKYTIINSSTIQLDRYFYTMIPQSVAIELLQHIARHLTGDALLTTQARLLLHFLKTAKPGKSYTPRKGIRCTAHMRYLIVETS